MGVTSVYVGLKSKKVNELMEDEHEVQGKDTKGKGTNFRTFKGQIAKAVLMTSALL